MCMAHLWPHSTFPSPKITRSHTAAMPRLVTNKHNSAYTSPICRKALNGQICMKFGTTGRLTDVINCAKHYHNRIRGFSFVEGSNFWHCRRNEMSPVTGGLTFELPLSSWWLRPLFPIPGWVADLGIVRIHLAQRFSNFFWLRTPILLRHSWRTPAIVTVKFTAKYSNSWTHCFLQTNQHHQLYTNYNGRQAMLVW